MFAIFSKRIRTLVAMTIYIIHRLIMGRWKLIIFAMSFWDIFTENLMFIE